MDFLLKLPILLSISATFCFTYTPTLMKCSYGDRGSLTATCVNATSNYFRITSYRFDHLDETVRCVNCNLQTVLSNSFDISGNQIITLDLHGSNITSMAPSSFVGLVYMKNLILSSNRIQSLVQATFRGIKKLVFLNLSNNNISMLVRDSFVELSNLTTLHLQQNLIRHVDSHAFNGLSSLTILYLQDNLIKDLNEVFIGLNSIQIIDLHDNLLEQIRPTEFNTSTLLDLNLAVNKLTGLDPDVFLQLSKLKVLNLSGNRIVTVNGGVFRGLWNLEVLDLSNSSIAQIKAGAFLRLYNLRDVDLSRNDLEVLYTVPFTALPELRRLNVSRNLIKEVKRTGVLSMNNLHTLDISHNKISDLDYKLLLQHAPTLIYINIEHNQWPCYLIDEMEKYFKEDNIQFTLDDKYKNISVECNSTVQRPKEVVSETKIAKLEAAVELSSSQSAPASVYVLYSLVFFLVVLVAVLFYLQYRTFTYLRGSGGANDLSDVRLITSSGLENRDGDY